MTLRAIIVDDEPLARSYLKAILDDIVDIEVVAQCENGFDAVDAVLEHGPDVMFLDVEMPIMTGFDVIKAIQSDVMPLIVFTTAYAQYAVDAFKVRAVNYVMKPLDDVEIIQSVSRAREALAAAAPRVPKSQMLTTLEPSQDRTLIVKDRDQIAFLVKSDIYWVEAEGDYVCLHLEGRTRFVRSTLKAIEAQLPRDKFLRIHRSTLVNEDRIERIIPGKKGEAIIVTKSGHRLKVSRSYGPALRERFR